MIQYPKTTFAEGAEESFEVNLGGDLLCGVFLYAFDGTLTLECRPTGGVWVSFQELEGAAENSYFPFSPSATAGLDRIRLKASQEQGEEATHIFSVRTK